jgi:hypothetical protein
MEFEKGRRARFWKRPIRMAGSPESGYQSCFTAKVTYRWAYFNLNKVKLLCLAIWVNEVNDLLLQSVQYSKPRQGGSNPSLFYVICFHEFKE